MNASINNSIIYNVYPTSFYDSNGDGIGDLKGITEKLEYIKQFADIVWINPVFQSPFRDGGYDVEDYYAIDKRFGKLEDVKMLTQKAHALGMKVLFDLVVGHTSDTHPWFLESQKHEKNQYSDYYIWSEDVWADCAYKNISGNSERDGNYLINFFCFQPALNFGFSEKKLPWQHHYLDEACCRVHEEVIRIIKYWMAMGIDGFRVDMAESIVKDDVEGKYSCEIWRKIFGKVREEYPEAIFVSEWGQPKYAVKNGDYDIDFLTHNFDDGFTNLFRKEPGANVFSRNGHSFFRKDGQGEAKVFFNYFLDNLDQIKDKGYISVVTGNHDLPRIGFERDEEDLKTVFAFLLALPCVPLIYYGDEIGMKYEKIKNKDGGYCRTGSRTPMQWTDEKNAGFSTTDGETYLPIYDSYREINVKAQEQKENSLINEVKKLVDIKRSHPEIFACGNQFELISEGYPLVFKRTNGKETLICAVNPSERTYTLEENVRQVLASSNVTFECGKAVLHADSYLWGKEEKDV